MASTPDLKALVLAAGFGSRLRPLTLHQPKPLLNFYGLPILHLALWKLEQAGISSVAVNTHHLGEQIEKSLQTQPTRCQIHVSAETKILGTGGALRHLDGWREEADVLIYNGDIISDIDLKSMIAKHRESGAAASMCLLPTSQAGKTPVYVHESRVVGVGKLPENLAGADGVSSHTFTGVHIVSAKILAKLPKGLEVDIWPAYDYAFAHELRVQSFIHMGFWQDIGSPKTYWSAHRSLLQTLGTSNKPSELFKRLGIVELCTRLNMPMHIFAAGTANFQRAQINGPTVLIGSDFALEHSSIGPEVVLIAPAKIGMNSQISKCLLLAETLIQQNESLTGQIITRQVRMKY